MQASLMKNIRLTEQISQIKTKFKYIFNLVMLGILILQLNVISKPLELADEANFMGINHLAFDPLGSVGGVAILDYDNDGFEDFYITSGLNQDKFYRNLGNGKFSEMNTVVDLSFSRGNYTNAAAAADIDNDGWTDLFITTGSNRPDVLLINNGDGTFSNISQQAGITTKTFGASITYLDINNDGLLDIYVGNYGPTPGDPCNPNALYVNKGNRQFVEEATKWGLDDIGCTLAVSFSDFDNDGRLEIFVANDFGNVYEKNKLFKFDSTLNKYKNIAPEKRINFAMNAMSAISGDYNEDGFIDYYVTNIDSNKLFKNSPSGIFEEVALESGVNIGKFPDPDKPNGKVASTSWGGAFIDINHDTYLDLLVANGHMLTPNDYKDKSRLFINNKNGTFTDMSDSTGFNSGSKSRGFAYFDYDNDGDLDIILVNVAIVPNKIDPSNFYHNYLNENTNTNWLKVKLQGTYTNRDAIGSRLTFHIGNRKLLREIHCGGDTFYSNNTLICHTGLGNYEKVDSIVVRWLDGDTKVVRNINKNQTIKIIQDYRTSIDTSACKGSIVKGRLVNDNISFVHKYIARNGADSLVTYNVTALDRKTLVDTLKFCEGDIFENQVLRTSRVTEFKGKTYYGCDSTYRRVLDVSPAPKINKIVDLCYGDFYGENQYFKNTKVTERVPSPEGCDSLNEVTINIKPTPKFEESTWICYGGFYNERKIYSDSIITKRYKTKFGCDSVYNLTLKVAPIKKYERQIFIESGEEYQGIKIEKDTILTFTSTTDEGCDSLTIIKIKLTTSIENETNSEITNLIKVYPNPLKEKLNINFADYNILQNSKEIAIYDLLGNLISKLDINNTILNQEIDLSNLLNSNQIYILKINISKKDYYIKLIKE